MPFLYPDKNQNQKQNRYVIPECSDILQLSAFWQYSQEVGFGIA